MVPWIHYHHSMIRPVPDADKDDQGKLKSRKIVLQLKENFDFLRDLREDS